MTIPQRLRFLGEVAGWINKPPPRKESSFNRSRLFFLLSSSRSLLVTARSTKHCVYRRSYCVCAYSAPLCAPTHASTCPILLWAAHLSTPRNNFAESHGVIRNRGCDWLGRNTTRFLELPMSDGTMAQSQAGTDEKRARPD